MLCIITYASSYTGSWKERKKYFVLFFSVFFFSTTDLIRVSVQIRRINVHEVHQNK